MMFTSGNSPLDPRRHDFGRALAVVSLVLCVLSAWLGLPPVSSCWATLPASLSSECEPALPVASSALDPPTLPHPFFRRREHPQLYPQYPLRYQPSSCQTPCPHFLSPMSMQAAALCASLPLSDHTPIRTIVRAAFERSRWICEAPSTSLTSSPSRGTCDALCKMIPRCSYSSYLLACRQRTPCAGDQEKHRFGSPVSFSSFPFPFSFPALTRLARGSVITAHAAATRFTVCSFPSDGDLTRIALSAQYTAEYYTTGAGRNVLEPSDVVATTAMSSRRKEVPIPPLVAAVNLSSYAWEVRLIGDGSLTASNYVASWVLQRAHCDALVGPGYSSLSVATSPVVNGSRTVWVDPFSTSGELSVKFNHPAFTRTIPTAGEFLVTFRALLVEFNWRAVNTLCIDDVYARSVVAGVADAMTAINGTVFVARCLPQTVTEADVASFMTFLEATSPSRVLFIAGLANAAMTLVMDFLARERYDERFIFVVTDQCISDAVNYRVLQSAICVMNTFDATFARPFQWAYEVRNTTAVDATLASMTDWSVPGFNSSTFSFITAFAHDGTLHAMRALAFADTSGVDRTAAARAITTNGFTGAVTPHAMTGDRLETSLQVFNAQRGANVPICFIKPGGLIQFQQPSGEPTVENETPRWFLFRRFFEAGESIPSDRHPTSDTPSSRALLWGLLGGCIAVVLALAVVAAVVMVVVLRRGSSKDNSNAPKDSTKPFAIVFTDIQASTALWARVPEQMSEAVDVHHATIRRLIARHYGYEVKTIGDSFMVAFHDAKAAVIFAVHVQAALFNAPWNTKHIDTAYHELGKEEHEELLASGGCGSRNVQPGGDLFLVDLESDPSAGTTPRQRGALTGVLPAAVDPLPGAVSVTGADRSVSALPPSVNGGRNALWRGLRVRTAVNYGLGKIQEDPVSTGFDYYGTVVNTAARVEGAAHGGQVLATHETLLAAGAVTGDSNAVVLEGVIGADLGLHTLRGLEEDVHLYQLSLPRFADRIFPPLPKTLHREHSKLQDKTEPDELDVDSAANTSATPGNCAPGTPVSSDPDVSLRAIAATHLRLHTFSEPALLVASLSQPAASLHQQNPLTDTERGGGGGGSPSNHNQSGEIACADLKGNCGGTTETAPVPEQESSLEASVGSSGAMSPFHPAERKVRRQMGDELLQCAFFLRTVLSTIPADRRKAMLRDIAIRWHVCPPERVGGRLDPSFNERAIVSTAWRVLETMKARPLRRPPAVPSGTTSGATLM